MKPVYFPLHSLTVPYLFYSKIRLCFITVCRSGTSVIGNNLEKTRVRVSLTDICKIVSDWRDELSLQTSTAESIKLS